MKHEPGDSRPNAVMSQEDLDRLVAQVQHELSGRLRDFRLKRRGDGVILMGRAGSYYAKQLAQHAAMEITGLPIHANEIEVR